MSDLSPLAPSRASASRAPAITTALIVGAVMLLSHPYTGVRHDGTLYAGDALARLTSGALRQDLYFYFGSQGRFTLLPWFYAGLIKVFGLGTGTIVGMFAAFCCYIAATIYLSAGLAPKALQIACILSVILGWPIYGGLRIFAYSESFLTARSFAEPAVLVGLGALLRGRRRLAAALLILAMGIHPLVGAGGLMVGWGLMIQQDRRWIGLAALGLVAIAVVGLVGVGPFDNVFDRYDDQWYALVKDINAQAFVLEWSGFDYGVIVFNLTVLWFVAQSVEGSRLRPFVIAVVVSGIGSMLVSLVAVDLLHNPFFGKVQIWRALWIMQWSAFALLPPALHALWQRGEHGRVVALLLTLGWMAPFSVAPPLVSAVAIAIHAARTRIVIGAATTRIVGLTVVVAGAVIAVQYEARVLKFGALFEQPLVNIAGQALAMNILLFVLAFFVLRRPGRGWVGLVVALGIFVGALSVWDQRGAWTRKLESYPVGTHIWPGLIEPDAKVYWYRDLIAPWVLLGHGNYYTQQQGSGAVFSRDMVVELDKRRKVTGILDFQEQICRMMNGLTEKAGSCEPDGAAVKTVCDDGGIDYVVLQSSLEGARPVGEFSTGVTENGYEKKFYLYRCSTLKP